MDRITIKKIIEINLKKGKISRIFKNGKTLETYNNFIDSIDKKYKLKICDQLSQLDTPMILVGGHLSPFYPVIYCFEDKYYIIIKTKTTITSDLGEAIDLVEKCFY